jgi:sigma-B regulation protein RsbU (phosphoserine phosphatase)
MKVVSENLLLQAPCGIFSFTDEGVITAANAYCCNLLEFEPAELVGKNIAALLSVSGRIFYQTHFYPLVKLHQHADEIFFNLQSKSKKDVPVVLNATVAVIDETPVIICSFIPVLNRRKYEDEILLAKKKAEEALNRNEELEKAKRELERQQRALDKQIGLLKFQNKELHKLSDVVTHDLQEPVRKLILFSNELQNRSQDNFNDHALSVIKKSSQKIKNLLLNLQNYLALTVKSSVQELVNLTDIVQYELQQLQNAFPQIQLQSKLNILPNVTGNKNQLNWMFHHILKNAFEHGTVDNTLSLSLHAITLKENLFSSLEDKYKYVDYVRIVIADKGSGFDSKYNEYIFDVLKRLDVTGERLGFGLSFCKRIAENHFGNLQAEGVPGQGATFTITLPIDNAS